MLQLNEITPWMDGGLVYGSFKAWADVLRTFINGTLAYHPSPPFANGAQIREDDFANQVPPINDPGLPFINPPPPANHTLLEVNRFWSE